MSYYDELRAKISVNPTRGVNEACAEVDRLRDQIRLRDLEADGVAVKFSALRRELEAVKADKEDPEIVRCDKGALEDLHARVVTLEAALDVAEKALEDNIRFLADGCGDRTALYLTTDKVFLALRAARGNAGAASAKENQGGAKTP